MDDRPSCIITNECVLLCGVDHRQHARRRATTRSFLEMRMLDSESDQKRDLEYLRLASDLMQLASATLNPELRAHCLRMATVLTDQVNNGADGQ